MNPRPSLSTLAIRRHIATLMLSVAVVILGLFFTAQLPIDLLPSITYPRIGVRADTPGVSPEVAVDEVTRPLEQALANFFRKFWSNWHEFWPSKAYIT